MEVKIEYVNSADLSGLAVRRHSKVPEKYRPKNYLDKFDATTLWYDVIEDGSTLYIICPKLNNLDKEIKQGIFRADGVIVKVKKIIQLRRTDIILINLENPSSSLSFISPKINVTSNISHSQNEFLSGRNCLFFINKNNNLNWIRDNVLWHIKHHGLQSLAILENQSDAYNNDDIVKALKGTGLESLVVLNLPFSYGGKAVRPYRHRESYLQSSSFNILKLRFLKEAGAVLNCDIDELVLPSDKTIFEEAKSSRAGYLRFKGRMTYQDVDQDNEILHKYGFHVLENEPLCPEKWCLVPNGKMKNQFWSSHSVLGLLWESYYTDKKRSFLHFWHVSSSWKEDRAASVDGLLEDHKLRSLLDDTYGV